MMSERKLGRTTTHADFCRREFRNCHSLVAFDGRPWHCGRCTLIVLIVMGSVFPGASVRAQDVKATPLAKQDSTGLLTQLAAEQVAEDGNLLGAVRFKIYEGTQTLSCDLTALPANVVLSDRDPYAIPLEALIRVTSLRRDFRATVPNEEFWKTPLNSVERAVQDCVVDIEATHRQQDVLVREQRCSENIEAEFEKLRTAIAVYAGARHLEIVEKRGSARGYQVQVKVEPPRARVRVMTVLEYRKCLYFRRPLEDQWIDLLSAENDMIGRYRYLAEWPPELNGPEEGEIEITRPTTITFVPKQK